MSQQSIEIKRTQDTVSIRAHLTAYVRKTEDGDYLSYCPALNLYAQGPSQQYAKESIIEATEMLLKGCVEDGTLDECLRECGFSLENEKKSVSKRSPKAVNGGIPLFRLYPSSAQLSKAAKKFGGKPIKVIPAEIPLLAKAA